MKNAYIVTHTKSGNRTAGFLNDEGKYTPEVTIIFNEDIDNFMEKYDLEYALVTTMNN